MLGLDPSISGRKGLLLRLLVPRFSVLRCASPENDVPHQFRRTRQAPPACRRRLQANVASRRLCAGNLTR